MEFKTAISKMTADDLIIHGKKHSEMVGQWPFSKTVFFLLSSKLPTEREEKLFDAMLTTVIDHGIGTASSLATRFVASTGNSLNTAVAGGVLALGDYHGGAIEKAMCMFKKLKDSSEPTEDHIKMALDKKQKLYGFGHKIYKLGDPRTTHLAALCKEYKFESPHLELALEIEDIIEKVKGKKIVLNVDGAIAALLLDMGFAPEMGKGFFIIGRTPSLVAQAVEEQAREKPVRRLDENDITYDGK